MFLKRLLLMPFQKECSLINFTQFLQTGGSVKCVNLITISKNSVTSSGLKVFNFTMLLKIK